MLNDCFWEFNINKDSFNATEYFVSAQTNGEISELLFRATYHSHDEAEAAIREFCNKEGIEQYGIIG